MPDMKTALEKALSTTLNEWAEDDKPVIKQKEKKMAGTYPVQLVKKSDGNVRFTQSVGVARAVFEYVRDHGGQRRVDIINTLAARGFKESSVGALITQYLSVGTFRHGEHNLVYCDHKEYVPVPTARMRREATKAKLAKKAPPKAAKATKPKADAGIAALKVDTGLLGVKVFDPQEFLNTLSVMQARSLYDELKKVFGG